MADAASSRKTVILARLLGLAFAMGISGPPARAASDEPVVALPPFLVEEIAKGPPWRYAEAAARVGSIRPRASYELARLRYVEFRAQPADEGRLGVRQAAEILKPLFAARASEPPLPEVYELIAEVWANAGATPTRGHLAVLDEGVRLFPRRTALALRAAEVNGQHGFRAEAAALLVVAARTASDAESRARIAALEQQLAPHGRSSSPRD